MEQIDNLLRQAGPAGLVVIFLAAAIEYIFPPFPGDSVTLLGGVYAVRGFEPVPLVFAAIMLGSLIGSAFDYWFGLWLGKRLEKANDSESRPWFARLVKPEQLELWRDRFQRRGVGWLVVNRFLPAVRGPIFVAAGVAKFPAAKALFWGGLSALLWNSLLFAAGYAVGGELDKLEKLVAGYGKIAWIVLGLVVVVVAARFIRRKRQARAH